MSEKSFAKREWPFWILIILPFLVIPFVWNILPDELPVHWNVHNQPDDYASKPFALMMIPVLNLALYFMFVFLPKIDPRKNNYEHFQGPWAVFRLMFHALMLYLFTIIIVAGTGEDLNIGFLVVFAVLALLTVVGNYLGNIRSNFFVGIKTPWTLADTEVWQKTHRMAAKLWFGLSIFMMLLVVVIPLPVFFWIFISYIATIVVVPLIYSLVIYKKKHGDSKTS